MTLANRIMEAAGQWAAGSDNNAGLSQPLAWLRKTSGYAGINRIIGLAIPFTVRNGFRVEELAPGYVRASIPLKGNRNHFGTLYAGAYFLVAEIPGGVLTLFNLGPDYVPILKEMTLQYHQAAKSDVTVVFSMAPAALAAIKRQADESGKAVFTLEGKLTDAKGTHVASSVAHYQVRKRGAVAMPAASS